MCVRKRTESCRSPAKSPKKMNARMPCSSLPTHSSQLFMAKGESDRFVSDNTLALARNTSLPQLDDEATFTPSQHSMFSYKAEDHVLKAKTKYDYGDRYVYCNEIRYQVDLLLTGLSLSDTLHKMLLLEYKVMVQYCLSPLKNYLMGSLLDQSAVKERG